MQTAQARIDASSSGDSLESSDMDSDPLPTATSPFPTDNAEVLSQEAPGRGETIPEAPQGDLPDSRSRGSKAPEGSEFGLQPNTVPEPPVVPDSSRRPSSKRGKPPRAGDIYPFRGTGQPAGSASRRFHRRRAPHYYECGDPEGSVRQERTD